MATTPESVLSPEQHTQLMTLMREKPALSVQENLNACHVYIRGYWAKFLAQPGWDEFTKAAEKAERFLAEHGQDLED